MSGHTETGDEKGTRMAREALLKARNGAPAQTAEVKESKPKTFFCAVCKKPIGKGTMTKSATGEWVCFDCAGKELKAKPEVRPVRVSPEYTASRKCFSCGNDRFRITYDNKAQCPSCGAEYSLNKVGAPL